MSKAMYRGEVSESEQYPKVTHFFAQNVSNFGWSGLKPTLLIQFFEANGMEDTTLSVSETNCSKKQVRIALEKHFKTITFKTNN
jgi:hypothetical protein